MTALANDNHLTLKDLTNNYIIANEGKYGICVLRVAYSRTEHARVPSDKKLRTLNPVTPWLTVGNQYVLPKSDINKRRRFSPLPINLIYTETLKTDV